ncbi:MAG TPA: protein kinase [Gemmatimonadales bacterium]
MAPAQLDRLKAALADRYRIERELGAGGMASVYLAHDVKHDRKVALKVLRPEVAAILGAERFLKEIKTAANLQHPHILPLHDSGEVDGVVFYVMPFVEGESLRDRLTREQQLPVDDAVRIATEVLDALDYAHEQGVIHRDIKPENILLHAEHALVADFGIALAASRSEGATRITETGMSLGTPGYMAPEQAMGERALTPRADIYAIGCVLYEMLSGEPPFVGPTAQAIIARVMTEEPRALTLHRHTIPVHVEAAVRRALEKLPADRFESAGAFARALADPGFTGSTRIHVHPASRGIRPPARLALLASMGLAGVALGASGVWLSRGHAASSTASLRFYLNSDSLRNIGGNLALSPDGTVLVYRANTPSGSLLFQQRLSELDPGPIPGTEDAAEDPGGIFFAPDGATIGFNAGTSIKRVRLDGSELATVTPLTESFAGATWGPDGTILYATYPEGRLYRVGAQGGSPTPVGVQHVGGDLVLMSPQFLPGGRELLCVNYRRPARIGVLSLASGNFKPLVTGLSPTYVPPGYLVFGTLDGSVMVQPFVASRGDTTGPASRVLENLSTAFDALAAYSMSASGVLAYAPRSFGAVLRLLQRDGSGRTLSSGRRFWVPRFSPDGRHIVYGAYGGANWADLWSYDLQTNTDQRLTSGGQEGRDYNDPVWSPDGRRIALSAVDSIGLPGKGLYLMPSDATSPPALLLDRPGDQWPSDWTRDGKSLLFTEVPPNGPRSIWLVRTSGPAEPQPIVKTPYNAEGGRLSPDGRWLAYDSDETGQSEVYLQRFPAPGPRLRVSSAGGQMPVWSRGGAELFYWSRNQLIAVQLKPGTEMVVGARKTLFRATYQSGGVLAQYDVHPDGQRFVIATPESSNRLAVITGVLANLKR